MNVLPKNTTINRHVSVQIIVPIDTRVVVDKLIFSLTIVMVNMMMIVVAYVASILFGAPLTCDRFVHP